MIGNPLRLESREMRKRQPEKPPPNLQYTPSPSTQFSFSFFPWLAPTKNIGDLSTTTMISFPVFCPTFFVFSRQSGLRKLHSDLPLPSQAQRITRQLARLMSRMTKGEAKKQRPTPEPHP